MTKLKLFIEDDTPMNRYIFDFIFEIIGIPYEQMDSLTTDVDIFYGTPGCDFSGKLIIEQNKKEVIWEELVRKDITPSKINGRIPFDIINAIKCFLTDTVNTKRPDSAPEAFDSHANLILAHSFQYAKGISELPIVNIYVSFLEQVLKHIFSVKGLPLWPENKKCAIGLSHDVDNPAKYSMLNAPLYLKGRGFKENLYLMLRRMTYLKMYYVEKQPEDYWLFDEIMELESSFGFSSTFYFASMNIRGEWSAGYDVPYDIKTERFVPVFKKMKKNGFEIGLHAGYNAFQSPDRFISEKKMLEETADCNVVGLRHHYWSMGRDIDQTLQFHAEAGFLYDTSISFNDSIGFRRNVALPYYPWDPGNSTAISTLQLPVFFMDSHFDPPASEHEIHENAEVVKHYTDTIKSLNGIGIIDYHVRTSYPLNPRYKNWAKTYETVLQNLSEDEEIWVDDLANITTWLKERRTKLAEY